MQRKNQRQNERKNQSSLSPITAKGKSAFLAIALNFLPPGMGLGLLYAAGPRALLALFPMWVCELWVFNHSVIAVVCLITSILAVIKIMQDLPADGKQKSQEQSPKHVPSSPTPVFSERDHRDYALKSFEGKLAEADRKLKERRTESGASKSGQDLIHKLSKAAATSHTLSDGSPESREAAAELLNVFQAVSDLHLPNAAEGSPGADIPDLASTIASPTIDFTPPVVPDPSSLLASPASACKNCGTPKGDFNFCTKCGLSFDL